MEWMYRILTESKNVDQVKTGLRDLGLDYTLMFGDGSWEGQPENSLIIELCNTTRGLAKKAVKFIKQTNDQKKVMLQKIPITSQLL